MIIDNNNSSGNSDTRGSSKAVTIPGWNIQTIAALQHPFGAAPAGHERLPPACGAAGNRKCISSGAPALERLLLIFQDCLKTGNLCRRQRLGSPRPPTGLARGASGAYMRRGSHALLDRDMRCKPTFICMHVCYNTGKTGWMCMSISIQYEYKRAHTHTHTLTSTRSMSISICWSISTFIDTNNIVRCKVVHMHTHILSCQRLLSCIVI